MDRRNPTHLTERSWRVSSWLFASALSLTLAASCVTEVVDNDDEGGSGGATAASTVASGTGGQTVEPGRGNPSDFPAECIPNCVQACERLALCEGDKSSLYPLDRDECLVRCDIAQNGPLWDDQSGNFLCCAAQDSCDARQHCGGWLKHPDANKSCDALCGCFFSGAVSALTDGKSAPDGYRFAPDLITIAPKASVRFNALDGVSVFHAGSYPVLRLSDKAPKNTASRLSTYGDVLPTFVDREGRISAATGLLIISLQNPTKKSLVEARTAHLGALQSIPYGRSLFSLRVANAFEALDVRAELDSLDGVSAELDMLRHYKLAYEPNDPSYGKQWHLKNTGQEGGTPGADGRVSEAWDITLGDKKVIIAVNDDGMDLKHSEFSGRLEKEQNFPGDWESQMMQGQFGSHGTSCAGVAAAAGDNNEQGSGVCPNCSVLPRLLGTNVGGAFQVTDKQIADGFNEMVDAGAWVISNSWGPGNGNPIYADSNLPQAPLATVRKAAFEYAESKGRDGKGTVIVFASGNSNALMDAQSAFDTNVAVTAVNNLGLKSYYSSFGPSADIAAPSNGGLSGITTTAFNGGETDSFGGTSSACPFVAGVFGLVLGANENLTAAEAREIVFASATKIDPALGKYNAEGISPYYGHGLVNAHRAVQLASGACTLQDLSACITPSDDCGDDCGSKTQCDECRSSRDCAPEHACQAVAALGKTVCVAEKAAQSCPAGTNALGDYCIPTRETCKLCASEETCNGQDDDCDGQVDEDNACEGENRYCWPTGPACADSTVCAGVRCIPSCKTDDECTEGQRCRELKDGYGNVGSNKGCVTSNASQCEVGCQVIASSLDDAGLADYVACMQDGAISCNGVFGCVGKLPINAP